MEIDEFRNALRALIYEGRGLELEELLEALGDAATQLRENGAESFGFIGDKMAGGDEEQA